MSAIDFLKDLAVDRPGQVSFSPGKCLRRRLSRWQCTACLEACPADALSLAEGSLLFSAEKCTGCMMCTTVCPNDAFKADDFSFAEMSRSVAAGGTATISCSRQEQIEQGDHVIPCVGVLSIVHLMAMGLDQSVNVSVNLSGCDGCENRPAAERFKRLVKTIQLQDRERVLKADYEITMKSGLQRSGISGGRRSFLTGAANNIAFLVGSRILPTPSRTESADEQGRRVPERVRLRRVLLEKADKKQKKLITSLCSPEIEVNSSCNACPLCKGMCPTGAISISKYKTHKSLKIDSTLCSGCGLCVMFCKLDALKLHVFQETENCSFISER